MKRPRRTKAIATVGSASRDLGVVERLIATGAGVEVGSAAPSPHEPFAVSSRLRGDRRSGEWQNPGRRRRRRDPDDRGRDNPVEAVGVTSSQLEERVWVLGDRVDRGDLGQRASLALGVALMIESSGLGSGLTDRVLARAHAGTPSRIGAEIRR